MATAFVLIYYKVINIVKTSFSGDARGLKSINIVGAGKSFIYGLFQYFLITIADESEGFKSHCLQLAKRMPFPFCLKGKWHIF